MSILRLIKPAIEYAYDIMQFRQELIDAGDSDSFAGCGSLRGCSTAKEWLQNLYNQENIETCPRGSVPSNTYLAVRISDNKIVGIIDLRHHIDHPILSVWGGHMGYSVRPSERGKGYATEMLRLNLQNCRDRRMEKILITCDCDNTASEKTIIANGGVFENEVCVDGQTIKRFWITLQESYNAFLDRINSFEKSEVHYGENYFKPHPSVAQKVSSDHKFKAFYGDTVVFNLNDTIKEKLSDYVSQLYQTTPECFCERLNSNTFHMTLHDLSNSPALPNIAAEVLENETRISKKAKDIKHQTIKMNTKYLFNMVNTSLVLGLYPINEEEYLKLIELYRIFDAVKELNYPFTPHITLAYYNPDGFSADSAGKLEKVVRDLNRERFEIVLDTDNLYYQKFTSMNDYVNILHLRGSE